MKRVYEWATTLMLTSPAKRCPARQPAMRIRIRFTGRTFLRRFHRHPMLSSGSRRCRKGPPAGSPPSCGSLCRADFVRAETGQDCVEGLAVRRRCSFHSLTLPAASRLGLAANQDLAEGSGAAFSKVLQFCRSTTQCVQRGHGQTIRRKVAAFLRHSGDCRRTRLRQAVVRRAMMRRDARPWLPNGERPVPPARVDDDLSIEGWSKHDMAPIPPAVRLLQIHSRLGKPSRGPSISTHTLGHGACSPRTGDQSELRDRAPRENLRESGYLVQADSRAMHSGLSFRGLLTSVLTRYAVSSSAGNG
jgi:hypothetical protein